METFSIKIRESDAPCERHQVSDRHAVEVLRGKTQFPPDFVSDSDFNV